MQDPSAVDKELCREQNPFIAQKHTTSYMRFQMHQGMKPCVHKSISSAGAHFFGDFKNLVSYGGDKDATQNLSDQKI